VLDRADDLPAAKAGLVDQQVVADPGVAVEVVVPVYDLAHACPVAGAEAAVSICGASQIVLVQSGAHITALLRG
jgi:hypothetical protein